MTARNDNLDLSRSSRISNEKADSSDLGAEKVKEVDSRAIRKRLYQSVNVGISYSTVDEIATFLFDHPQHIAGFMSSMYELAALHAAWQEFAGMRENLNHLVDVRIRIAELRGQKHTGTVQEAGR